MIGKYRAPGAPMRLSLTPMRVRRAAPLLDQHRKEVLAELEKKSPSSQEKRVDEVQRRRPLLTGLRMADLTQQYAGPLGTALLAYYGMEVGKIETGTIPSKEREAAVHACMNRARTTAINFATIRQINNIGRWHPAKAPPCIAPSAHG